MPWKVSDTVEQRMRFVLAYESDQSEERVQMAESVSRGRDGGAFRSLSSAADFAAADGSEHRSPAARRA